MVVRNIVHINEELCNGCGQCIPNCAEGALQLVNGKAKIVKDMYCDGLGDCLGHCPQGALSIIQREADQFSEKEVHAHLAEQQILACGCPSTTVQTLETIIPERTTRGSSLRNWPVQLKLVPLEAPFFEDADLLVVADCVPVAYPNLHGSLLSGRTVVIGCPKFDDARGYTEKLGEILRRNDVRSVTVAHMEVPCCSGLNWVVDRAIVASGKPVPVKRHVIGVRGEMR